jgi:hypothetical protein
MNFKKEKSIWVGALMIGMIALLPSCSSDDDNPMQSGQVKVYITDAPVDDANVEAVVISVNKIEMNGPRGWEPVKEFDTPFSINILDYQNGKSYFVTDANVTAGAYTEARFVLNADTDMNATVTNPPCFIRYKDGSKQPLFIPSGTTSGYKAKGTVEVVANSTTEVTLDFDARRSIVEAGNSGKFILKPTVRLVANTVAAKVEGSFTDFHDYSKVVAYLYEKGSYTSAEATVTDESEARFSNSVTSTMLNTSGDFTFAFLAPGSYDVVLVAHSTDGEFTEVIGKHDDTTVSPGATVELNLSLSILID